MSNNILNKFPNIFICGLSGSGKDTLVSEFCKRMPFVKIRLAETLKRMITEVNGISFDELENLKRVTPKLRSQHNEFDVMLRPFTDNPDLISSASRYDLIINRKSMDFTNPVIDGIDESLMNNPIIIIDGRDSLGTRKFIEAGYVGIFLTRTNHDTQFRNTSHETEADNISNGTVEYLCAQGFADNIYIVNNDSFIRNDISDLKEKYPELYVKNTGRIDSENYIREANILIDNIILYYSKQIENGKTYRS